MGFSLMGVAKSSELRFAQSEELKKRADIRCLRLIVFGVLAAIVVGVVSFFYIKYDYSHLWEFRKLALEILFGGCPVMALFIYFGFYRAFLPFARSIEAARTSSDLTAPVTRFQQLLLFRVALYLVCLLLFYFIFILCNASLLFISLSLLYLLLSFVYRFRLSFASPQSYVQTYCSKTTNEFLE
jgi:hypothetical protein